MLRSHWRAIVAVVGCLVLVTSAWLLLQPRKPIVPAYEQPQKQSATYRPGGSSCDPARLRTLPDGEAATKRDGCEEAAEQHRIQSNDLIQQTRAADAAYIAADLTYRQTLIGLAGTMIGFATLIAAVLAAYYAKKAAEAAERSIGAALETSQAELRAYIKTHEETVSFVEETNTFVCNVVLLNAGVTPAHKCGIHIRSVFEHSNGGVDLVDDFDVYPGLVAPGQTTDLPYRLKITPENVEAMRQKKRRLSSYITAIFVDSFDQAWKYTQHAMVDHNSFASGSLYSNDCRQQRYEAPDPDAEDEPSLPLVSRKPWPRYR